MANSSYIKKVTTYIATMTSTCRSVSAWLMIYIDSNLGVEPRAFHDGALLICADWTTSSWWLQKFWIQIGTRPSAIIMLTIYNVTWIISRQHTHHITVIKQAVLWRLQGVETPLISLFLMGSPCHRNNANTLTDIDVDKLGRNWVVIGLSPVRCQLIITHANAYLLSWSAKFSEFFIKIPAFFCQHTWKNVPHFVQASICWYSWNCM